MRGLIYELEWRGEVCSSRLNESCVRLWFRNRNDGKMAIVGKAGLKKSFLLSFSLSPSLPFSLSLVKRVVCALVASLPKKVLSSLQNPPWYWAGPSTLHRHCTSAVRESEGEEEDDFEEETQKPDFTPKKKRQKHFEAKQQQTLNRRKSDQLTRWLVPLMVWFPILPLHIFSSKLSIRCC